MIRIYLVFVILAFGHLQVLSQGEIILTDDNLGSSFANLALLLEDADHQYDAHDIMAMPSDSFIKLSTDAPAVQFTTSCYWMRFSIINESSSATTFFLETARPVTDQIHFYSFEGNKIVQEMVNGDDFDYDSKIVKHRKNIFPIKIEKGEKKDIILAILSGGEGIILPLIIHEKTTFFELDYKNQFRNGFYYGLMGIIIVIYFFFFLLLKDITFLYYILYVFFQGMLQFSLDGYSHQHFFPDNGYMIHRLPLISGGMTILFMLVYVVHFLHSKNISKYFLIALKICGLLVILSFIFTFLTGRLHYLSFPIVNAASLLSLIVAVVTIFHQKSKGYEVDIYFTIAFVVLIVGAVIFILGNFNIIKNAQISLNALKVSSMFEVIILSISMSYKYRTLQKEKEDAQVIALKNLKEKNAIMDEANVKLEEQVVQRTSEIESQRSELAYKNKEIISSIQYAKRIQEAILPSDSRVERLLTNAFVFYLPKDVVSGDFYFVDRKPNGTIVFAAVDCTGHGVPGAFMSIVGNNFLNQSILEKNLTSPASILGFLNIGLSNTFKYNSSIEAIRDGMDIALCTLNQEMNELDFSGAKNPLYLVTPKPVREDLKSYLKIENDTHALIEIKGDKHPIGNYSDMDLQSYKNHKIMVEKNDVIYIFTDGYADQFGGGRVKKFNYRRFRAFLLEIAILSMEEQRSRLEQNFYNWKGDLEQIDDVLVMGIKI